MSGTQAASRWRFLITPKWLGWHVFVIFATAGMLWLGSWQLHRAESGNALSWAYTFEWPLLAIFVVVFWIKTIRDEIHPPVPTSWQEESGLTARARRSGEAAGEPDGDDDEDLVAYNAYLARLSEEVRGHGRWHGLR
jgi:DNA-binding transcriptional regulator of glucitol operon